MAVGEETAIGPSPLVLGVTSGLPNRRNRITLDLGVVDDPPESSAQNQDEDHQRPHAQPDRESMPPTPRPIGVLHLVGPQYLTSSSPFPLTAIVSSPTVRANYVVHPPSSLAVIDLNAA